MCIEFPWRAPFRVRGVICAVEGGRSQVLRRPHRRTRTAADPLLRDSLVLWKLQSQESVFPPGHPNLTVGCYKTIPLKGISFTKNKPRKPQKYW